tara:strand:+ start:1790 stop:2317 length:528 start_codon:yes stop_codon:yes gene_type:complete
MSLSENLSFALNLKEKQEIKKTDLDDIDNYIYTANIRIDAILAITEDSSTIAAEAVTGMLCEKSNDSVNLSGADEAKKLSVCLRDGEIILRYITYGLLTEDASIFDKSCLKDLKSTYLSLGVSIPNVVRVIEIMRNGTLKIVKNRLDSKSVDVIHQLLEKEIKMYFDKIIYMINH